MVNREAFSKLLEFAKLNNIAVKKDKNGHFYFEYSMYGNKYIFSEGKPFIDEYKINTRFIQMDFRNFKMHYQFETAKNMLISESNKILTDLFDMKNKRFSINKKTFIYSPTTNKITEEGTRDGTYIFQFLAKNIGKETTPNDVMSFLQKFYLPSPNRYRFHLEDTSKWNEINNFIIKSKEERELDKKFIPLIMNSFNEIYQENLFSDLGRNARRYLYNRGLNNEEIKKLGLGLGDQSKDYVDDLKKRLEAKVKSKIGRDDYALYEDWTKKFEMFCPALELGLVNYTKRTGRIDAIHNRISFPIKDDEGNIVAFGGRKYFEDGKETPKYMLTKTSQIWRKTDVLYGLNEAKESEEILKTDRLMIVEGFMDANALNKIGIPAVALMGVSISDNQISLLKQHFPEKMFFVSLDFDNAGSMNNQIVLDKIAKSVPETILKFNKPVEIKSKDFDEYINQNNEVLTKHKVDIILTQQTNDYLNQEVYQKEENQLDYNEL